MPAGTAEAKARLRPIAWNQPPITEAAVTFIFIGRLADASTVPERLAPVVEAGIMPAHLVPEWEISTRGLYDELAQLREPVVGKVEPTDKIDMKVPRSGRGALLAGNRHGRHDGVPAKRRSSLPW